MHLTSSIVIVLEVFCKVQNVISFHLIKIGFRKTKFVTLFQYYLNYNHYTKLEFYFLHAVQIYLFLNVTWNLL